MYTHLNLESQLESRFLRHGTNVHQTWNDAHEKSDSRDELEKSVPLWKPQIDNGPTQNYPSQTVCKSFFRLSASTNMFFRTTTRPVR